KILDLGLALVQGEVLIEREIIGGQGYVVGTMDYIAPEQTEDPSRVDPRSDLYALGCTLYFALTGKPPFPGGTPQEKIRRQRTEEPQPVPQLNATVPPGFIGLVRRLMAKNPDQRFATAAELREELLKWTSAEPVLPMDKQGEAGYDQAVLALENASASADLVVPVPLPEVEPAPEKEQPTLLQELLPDDEPRSAAPFWTFIGLA